MTLVLYIQHKLCRGALRRRTGRPSWRRRGEGARRRPIPAGKSLVQVGLGIERMEIVEERVLERSEVVAHAAKEIDRSSQGRDRGHRRDVPRSQQLRPLAPVGDGRHRDERSEHDDNTDISIARHGIPCAPIIRQSAAWSIGSTPSVPAHPRRRFGALTFVHRFGSALDTDASGVRDRRGFHSAYTSASPAGARASPRPLGVLLPSRSTSI